MAEESFASLCFNAVSSDVSVSELWVEMLLVCIRVIARFIVETIELVAESISLLHRRNKWPVVELPPSGLAHCLWNILET